MKLKKIIPLVVILISALAFVLASRSFAAPIGCQGNCYWIGGSGSFSDVSHWAMGSRDNPSCGCTPNGDNIIIDATGLPGLVATQNLAVLQTGPVTLIGNVTIQIANDTVWYIGQESTVHIFSDSNFNYDDIFNAVKIFIFVAVMITIVAFSYQLKQHRTRGR